MRSIEGGYRAFRRVAGYARRLQETSSRGALVATLAELFTAAAPDEVASATYLLQGRVAPAFVPLELGMGVVLVSEAIARLWRGPGGGAGALRSGR
jgi:hypothetical protein